MNYLVRFIFFVYLLLFLFPWPFMAYAQAGKAGVLNQDTIENAKIKISRLLSELEKIEKIIEKQNNAYEKMKGEEKKFAVPLKKISKEEAVLEAELQNQRVKIARRMRTVFPYKRSRIINYILGESRSDSGSFFRDIQLFKISTRKDAKLIRDYKSKLELLKKKKENTGLHGKA